MKFNRNDWLICLVYLGLALLFFHRFLTAEQIFGFKDLSRYFYPLRYLMVEQVKAGYFPLWNPYIFCGYPLLATLQICFFYPLSFIYYVLPFDLAFNYYIILHYFLAACFMYFLLRHYELSRVASFLGGMVFAFSGYLLSVSNMNTSLSSVIWLPLVLLAFDRLLKNMNFINIAMLGLLLAIQFLGGEPTIIYVTLFFLVAYAGTFSGSWRSFFKNMRGLAGGGLIALGLVAVQLLPFLELARLSDRVVRTAYELVTFRSFPPREILTFVFPYFFGNPGQFASYSETLLGKNIQDWLISPYLGILPLIFVFLSFKQRRPLVIFFMGAALVSLVLSFGKYTPLYKLVYLFPGISMVRYPVKYLFMTNFCLVILASFGFEWLWVAFRAHKEKILGFIKIISVVLGFSLLIFVLVYFFRLRLYEFFAGRYSANVPPYFFSLLARIIEFNLISFLFIILYLFAFLSLLIAAYKNKIKKSVFVFLIIILVGADLFANGSSIAIPISKDVFKKVPENFEILQSEKGIYRFFYPPELKRENQMIYGKDYNEALFRTKDNFASNWHIPYHFYDFYGYESVKPLVVFAYYQKLEKDRFLKKFEYLSLSNVKYIASIKKLNLPHLRLLRHKSSYGVDLYLYENQKVFPRAFILNVKKKPELLKAKAKIIKYSAHQIEISTELQEAGYLFLSDSYYPGWRVFVDGSESKIMQSKGFFRKVKLSPGKHKVKFIYDPLSFKIGAIISLLTILGIIITGLIIKKDKK